MRGGDGVTEIRRCSKCNERTRMWSGKGNKMVCRACHDSNNDKGHAAPKIAANQKLEGEDENV